MSACFDFAEAYLRQGYKKFKVNLTPVVASLVRTHPAKSHLPVEEIAHLLASAVRGFKQTATTPDQL